MAPRRVLMIAHHFPPAAGSGSNRALAFARYLAEHGWQPTVVTPRVEWAAHRDDALARELPSSVHVVRTRSLEALPRPLSSAPATVDRGLSPAAARIDGVTGQRKSVRASTLHPLRAQLGHLKRFPDAHIGWLPYALAAARHQAYELAYSSSGPFTSHVVGLALKKLTRRPWVAELRDGWYRWNRAIFPDYPVWRDALERRLEAAALRSADRVVLVTDRMADAFRCQYPDLPRGHFRVVSNGFDPAQYSDLPSPTHDSSAFNVVHSGALYYGRSLSALLEAADRLCRSNASFARAFKLTLLGSLDATAREELRRNAIHERIHFVGQVSHAESLAAMRAADVLLLVANTTPGAEAAVPGKLFEYLAVGRPVLAVAPLQSSTADVLRQTAGGWLAASGDVSAIACALEQAFVGQPRQADPAAVARFSRRELTADLAAVFDELA